jgi:hypothetical protein
MSVGKGFATYVLTYFLRHIKIPHTLGDCILIKSKRFQEPVMDKLQLIKEVLNTDAQTDKKIFEMIQSAKACGPDCEKVIQIDERENVRKPVSLRVNINTGKKRIMGRVEDISLSGAFICTEKKIPRGEQLAVRLISSRGEEFDFISEVVRVESTGVGILIKSISPLQEERFHEFVNQL